MAKTIEIDLTDEQFDKLMPIIEEFENKSTKENPGTIFAQVWLVSWVASRKVCSASIRCRYVDYPECVEIQRIIKQEQPHGN